jgi:Patatin-like phospholipase
MRIHQPRILSLDGGGVRGLSSLLILREIMEEIQRKSGSQETPLPCQYFDLIGGTSTGGLIATMLGRLRMVLSSSKLLADAVVGRDMYYQVHRLEREGLPHRPSHCWENSHRR